MAQRRTVADLEENVSAILTGLDLTLVNDLYGAFERAASIFVQKADVPETMVRQPLMLYSGVTDYAPSENMFGAGIIDLRPQGVEPMLGHNVQKTFIVEFDGTPNRVPFGYLVSFEYRQGDPIMRVAQGKTVQQVNIDSMTSLDGWAVGGDASTLLLDNTVYYHAPAALRFNLAPAGTQGTLEKTLTNPLNLTNYQGVGVAFLAVYFPNADQITSLTLRLGSDSSNYYEVTVTQGFLGALYSNDYQLVAFDFAHATTVGAPDSTAIQYVDILTTYDGGTVTYGSELVTNGSFAAGSDWTLGLGWSYGANKAVHTPGVSTDTEISQLVAINANSSYLVTFDAVVTAGTVELETDFAGENEHNPAPTTGAYSFTVLSGASVGGDVVLFNASDDFDGSITNVSVKEITSSGTGQNNVRYGDLFISLPSPHEALFYSAAVFKAVDDYSIYVVSENDEIIFRDAAYNIYQYEAARAVAQNQGAGIGSAMIAAIDLVLEGDATQKKAGLYQQFRGDNPSEELRTIGSWYDGINDGPGAYGGYLND